MTDYLDYHGVRSLMGRMSYKPNVEFQLLPVLPADGYGAARIHAVMYVPDSYASHPPVTYHEEMRYHRELGRTLMIERGFYQPITNLIPVSLSQIVPDCLHDERQFLRWFRSAVIGNAEDHEADEWFKIDGKCVRNPHEPPIKLGAR